MSRVYLSQALRRKVAEQARHRCGYCLSSETLTGSALEIDHLLPQAAGGETKEENLWLACSDCNSRKSDRTTVLDPLTKKFVPLFNPRRDKWHKHFAWSTDGQRVIPLTAVGRATVL